MITKQDIKAAIDANIANYPDIEPRYRVDDPLVHQAIDAMATMITMLSQQVEVAELEPFDKVRESSIMAHAANKGIFNRSVPCNVSIDVVNNGATDIVIGQGRILLDSTGRLYTVDKSVSITANSTVLITATQQTKTIINHVVKNSIPYYSISIPNSNDSSFLSNISVNSNGYNYQFRDSYINVFDGDYVFNVEVDNKRNTFIRFGKSGTVGVQPANDDIVNIELSYSFGNIQLKDKELFTLEYIQAVEEPILTFNLNSILTKGSDPLSTSELRDLCKYPAIYDNSAVMLGNFEYLVRKNNHNIKFLSVWNEALEEKTRGASIDNINTLFVACFYDTEQFLVNNNIYSLTPPNLINRVDYTPLQLAIENTINNSDDSYKVKFYTPIQSKIVVDITATISSSYDAALVSNKIKNAIISQYGINSVDYRKKTVIPLNKDIYTLLRANVAELKDDNSDFSINIKSTLLNKNPENWVYVALDSINVNIRSVNVSIDSWTN